VPAFYPTFAEYSEPGTNEDPAVVDTGPVLRAFLPLREQQPRFNIADYKGVATVLDSRVVCVRPEIENPQIQTDGNLTSGFWGSSRFALTGLISASPPAHIVLIEFNISKTPHGCVVDPSTYLDSVWRITLCQLGPFHLGLGSQFTSESDLSTGSGRGPVYLVLNVTTWKDPVNDHAVRTESNGEWLDLVFKDDGSTRISASLCISALDTADLFIHAFSGMNHTEPLVEFDSNSTKYRYDKVRSQLGQRNDGSWIHDSFEDRGILQLQPRHSWRTGTCQGDYIRPYHGGGNWPPYISWVNNAARFENLNLITDSDIMAVDFSQNYSAYLGSEHGGVFVDDSSTSGHNFSSIYPDPSFASLLQDILQHGGNIAHGLSSLLTVQASSTYYDQLPQFDGRSETSQRPFELVLIPQTYRGYSAVAAIAAAHLILVATILFKFLTGTKISTICNTWQTLAQIKDPLTEELLDFNTLSSDDEVNLWMKGNADAKAAGKLSEAMGTPSDEVGEPALPSALRPDDIVGIRLASSGTRTELARRQRLRDTP